MKREATDRDPRDVRSLALARLLAAGCSLGIAGCVATVEARRPSQRPPLPSWEATVTELPSAPPAAREPPLAPQGAFDPVTLAERVRPAVVNITTKEKVRSRGNGEEMDPFEFFFGPDGGRRAPVRTGLGSGFIIDPAGYILTNEHVVHDASDVRVRLADEREFKADVVGRDPKLDVALLRIQGARGLPAVRLGSSGRIRVGEPVMAVGNPFGLGHTVTVGIVSATARAIGAGPYDDFIQTDASINPGNSGGPLFDANGDVVGMATAIRAGASGIGFAIPADAIREVLPELRAKGRIDRGKLGLRFQRVTPDLAAALGMTSPTGALVAEVEPGSAAARAGIRPGDVVVAIGGVPIAHAEGLARTVARHPPGSRVMVAVIRDHRLVDLPATLDRLEDEEPAPREPPPTAPPGGGAPPALKLGVRVADVPGVGVRVEEVIPGREGVDLRPGDVIVEIDRTPVKNVEQLRQRVAKLRPGATSLLRIEREGGTLFIAVPVPRP